MGMKRGSLSARAILLITVILGNLSLAQSGRVGPDQSAQQGSAKSRDGFVDFTLNRMNHSETDYGRYLSEGRRMLVEETIRNAYFWSNVASLAALACLFFIVLYQNRIQTKRDLATAEIIGQYEQTLARSRVQIAEASKKNRELADALTVLKEPTSRSTPLPLESSDNAIPSTKPRTVAQTASLAPAKTNSARAQVGSAALPATAKAHIDQMRLFTPDADFVMKLNSLEQQLAQSREDNKQLRRRIAEGDRKLETEQERNSQLKGT